MLQRMRRSMTFLPSPSGVSRTLAHVRVAIVGRRGEQLLDGAGVDPARQVENRAGLVVRAAGPRPSEGLLTDHRAAGLVIDVEVAGPKPHPPGARDEHTPARLH